MDTEIEKLELALGSKLPKVYKNFLIELETSKRQILVGSDFKIDELLLNNEGLIELLKDNNLTFELPKKYLCFLMHQGYIAFWIDLDSNSDDPNVWNYSEGTTKEPRMLEKLSEFIPSIVKEWGSA